jgi:hypothetical protein
MRTTELMAEAQRKVDLFDKKIANVLEEIGDEGSENEAAKTVAVAIMEFANLMEEIYLRILKRQTSKRVVFHQCLNEMRFCSINEDVIHCLSKIKQFRNRIAHSTVLERPVVNYFTKKTTGVDRIATIKYRMNLILENAKDDVSYAYIFVEAS